MELQFNEKTVLISGASGYLGTQLAKDYSKSNVQTLVLLDQPECKEKLEHLKEQLQGVSEIYTYTADLRNVDEIKEIVNQMEQKEIKIDILVNSAGINILKKAGEMDEKDWDWVIDVNLKGSFFLTSLVGQMSLLDRSGNVVFISSQHGVVGNIMRTAYCSSKTGILGLVRALTAEWSVFGVRVNAVSPTYIINERNKDFLMNGREVRNMLNKIPLHRYATVEDVSSAVLFLSSDHASMITGQNLVVDGGYTSV